MSLRAACVVTLAFIAHANAETFHWRHNAYWKTSENWASGKVPGAGTKAVLSGMKDCGNPTNEVSLKSGSDVAVSAIELWEGVNLVLEEESTIDFGEPIDTKDEDLASGWRCKAPEETDMRCGQNWATDADSMEPSGEVPCRSDSVHFTTSSHVKTSSLPFFASVTIGNINYTKDKIGDATSLSGKQFSAGFIADGYGTFLSSDFDQQVADMDCYDTCPSKEDDYDEALKTMVDERVFIEENFAESAEGVIPPSLTQYRIR
jgi:hypothetical protein